MTLVVANMLCLVPAASDDRQLPDVKQIVHEIVDACAIGPTNSLKEALSSNLEKFLRQAIETKSADPVTLNNLLERLPTDTDETRAQLKNERARQTFFTIYFDCIRHQVGLKLKSLGIAFV
jgi:hypothetical protein